MNKHLLVLATSACVLACGALSASAQQTGGPFIQQPGQPEAGQPRQATEAQRHAEEEEHARHFGRMMGHERMMEMMRGGMSQAPMGAPVMMRMIFALMDADGDGTVSLDEFKAAHERIFKAMDTDHDGTVSLDEMLAFMRGAGGPAPRR